MEERKNTQISDLIQGHEKSFNEMKNYYNDITLNNLALISSLKVFALFLFSVVIFVTHILKFTIFRTKWRF